MKRFALKNMFKGKVQPSQL